MCPNTLRDFLVFSAPEDCLYKIQKYLYRPQPRELMLEIAAQKEKTKLFDTLLDRIYQVKCLHSGHKFHPSRDTRGLYGKLKRYLLQMQVRTKNIIFIKKIFRAGERLIMGGGGADVASWAAPPDADRRIWLIWCNLTVEEIKEFILDYDHGLIRDWYYQIPIHNRPVPYKWMYLFNTAETKCLLEPYKSIVDYYAPDDIAIQMILDY